jgi:hypothetical protein
LKFYWCLTSATFMNYNRQNILDKGTVLLSSDKGSKRDVP